MVTGLRRRGASGAVAGLVALAIAPATPAGAAPSLAPTPAPAVSTVGGADLARPGVVVSLPAGVKPPPVPAAAAWLVADLNSGAVLAASNSHVPMATASTMKIFTALALAPRLNPKASYLGRPADAAMDGTKVGIVPGSRYTIDDLLHGLLMSSGNDCANALGTAVGGQSAALRLTAETARAIGALDTVPRTTSGLDAPGQVSSAYDLALAGRAALADRQLAAIMTTRHYRFPAGGAALDRSRKRFDIQNHNKLLARFPGATGVKNGYTVAAGGSFVGSATRAGRSYIAVIVRAKGLTWKASADLLTWAFAAGSVAVPVGHLVSAAEAAQLGSIGPGGSDPGDGRLGAAAAALDPAGGTGRRPGTSGRLDDIAAGLRWALLAAVSAAGAVVVLRLRRPTR